MDDIVIDTHIVIWYFADPTQLSVTAEAAIDKAEANGTVFVSAITIVELTLSHRKIQNSRRCSNFIA